MIAINPIRAATSCGRRHASARCIGVRRRAADQQRFVGEHDGYRALRDPLTHRREITYDASKRTFTIIDTLECKSHHTVRLHWHCSEHVQPIVTDREVCSTRIVTAFASSPTSPPDRVLTFRGGTAEEGGWVSRGFGRKTARHDRRLGVGDRGDDRLSHIYMCGGGD